MVVSNLHNLHKYNQIYLYIDVAFQKPQYSYCFLAAYRLMDEVDRPTNPC